MNKFLGQIGVFTIHFPTIMFHVQKPPLMIKIWFVSEDIINMSDLDKITYNKDEICDFNEALIRDKFIF